MFNDLHLSRSGLGLNYFSATAHVSIERLRQCMAHATGLLEQPEASKRSTNSPITEKTELHTLAPLITIKKQESRSLCMFLYVLYRCVYDLYRLLYDLYMFLYVLYMFL